MKRNQMITLVAVGIVAYLLYTGSKQQQAAAQQGAQQGGQQAAARRFR